MAWPSSACRFIEGLNSPFGMALVGSTLYVANTDARRALSLRSRRDARSRQPAQPVVDLPGGPLNHHWTKNIIASPDGSKLYATVGSNSNVGENGIDKEEGRAAIWEIDLQQRSKRLFATGLRNPNGLAWEPATGALWTVVNERDELGSDLVPDYLTCVSDGGFYGWPYSYYGQHVDERVEPQRPDLVASAKVPDYALGTHVAPLGLVSYEGSRLPAPFVDGMVIGEHGSWNRKPLSGYKVVFVPFANGKPQGKPIDRVDRLHQPRRRCLGPPGRRGGRSPRRRCWWPTTSATRCGASSCALKTSRARRRQTAAVSGRPPEGPRASERRCQPRSLRAARMVPSVFIVESVPTRAPCAPSPDGSCRDVGRRRPAARSPMSPCSVA